MKNTIKLFILMLLTLCMCAGCGNNIAKKGETKQVNKEQKTSNVKGGSEEFVKKFYSSEVTKSVEELNSYYYDSNVANFELVKEELKKYKVKKIEFSKVINKETNKNLEVLVCSYKTYFEGIKEPKSYMEIVSLVYEKGRWYIINNYKDLSIEDIDWIQKAVKRQNLLMEKNDEAQKITEQQKKFNKDNREFLEKVEQ